MTDIREQEMQGKNRWTDCAESVSGSRDQTAAQAGRMVAQGSVRPQVGNKESRVPGRTDESVQ